MHRLLDFCQESWPRTSQEEIFKELTVLIYILCQDHKE